MTTMPATPITSTASLRTLTPQRVGLLIAIVLGLASLPIAFMPIQTDGGDGPPLAIIILATALSLLTVVCSVIAWPSGNRIAIRINAAAILLNALSGLPALFVDVPAWVKVGTALATVLSVIALVLMLRREREALTVTD